MQKWFIKIIRAALYGSVSSYLFCPSCYTSTSSENILKVLLYYFLVFLITYEIINFGVKLINKKYNWINNTKQIIIANTLLILLIFLPLNYIGVELNFGAYPENFSQEEIYFLKLVNFFTALLILFYLNSSNFLYSWKKSVIEKQELGRQQIKYELLALKNQINPHFLFNNLNTLSHLINKNKEIAEEYIYQFSKIYRYLLEQKNSNLVSIEDEIKMIESLVYLLQVKHEKNIKIIFAKTKFKNFKIAPFTLQMLLENVVKHNVINDDHQLTIVISKDEKHVFVKNNLTEKPNAIFSAGIGLENIINRYRLLTDEPVIIIENKTEFIVKIPII